MTSIFVFSLGFLVLVFLALVFLALVFLSLDLHFND
jgi:hypothetical protein